MKRVHTCYVGNAFDSPGGLTDNRLGFVCPRWTARSIMRRSAMTIPILRVLEN